MIRTALDHQGAIQGFITGKVLEAPKVYNPGGLTLMVDDFCVANEELWPVLGGALLKQCQSDAKDKGVTQLLVVTGAHDAQKKQFLSSWSLTIASEWYVGEIPAS